MVDTTTTAFFISLAINGGIAILLLLIFSWLRLKYKDVYEPRKQARWRKENQIEPSDVPSGLLGWIKHTYSISDDHIYHTAGLDAVMYIKFLSMTCQLFFFTMIPALLIWLPVNYTDNNLILDKDASTTTTVYNSTTGQNQTIQNNVYKPPDDFGLLSMANIHNDSNRLLLPLLGLWLFTFFALYLAFKMWQSYMSYRHLFLIQQQSQGKSLSLLVHNIPPKSTSQTMTDFFRSLYPSAFVSAVVARDVDTLPKLIAERETAIAKLERAHYDMEHLKPGAKPPQAATKMLCCGKVDAIEHWTSEIQRLNNEISEKQQSEHSLYRSGFVTFNSSFIVSSLSKLDQTKIPYEYQCLRAPDVDDVYYPNLRMSRYERLIRIILFTCATYALVVFWAIPVAFAASFANLKALAQKAAFLSFINSIPDGALSLIQGYMPAIILAIFYFLLPIILLTFARNEGIEGHTWQNIAVLKKMFIFMVVNYFLVFVLSGSFFNQLAPILSNPLGLPATLGIALPSQANAFATIILFKGLAGFPVQALQIGNLVGILIIRKYLAKTEREIYNSEKPSDMNYSASYPNHLYILVLGCVYVVMAPIITVFASIYFILGYIICKYQAVYMIVPTLESGGRHWPVIFGRLCASLVVGQLTMIGLFGVKEYAASAVLSVPLPIITILFYYSMMDSYINKCDFLPVQDAVETDVLRLKTLNVQNDGTMDRTHLLSHEEEKEEDHGGTSSSLISINDSSTRPSTARNHPRTSVVNGPLDPYTQNELLIGRATVPTTAAWSNRDLSNPSKNSLEGNHEMTTARTPNTSPPHKLSDSDAQQIEIHN